MNTWTAYAQVGNHKLIVARNSVAVLSFDKRKVSVMALLHHHQELSRTVNRGPKA